MSGISSRRVRYGIGDAGSSWTANAIDEGLPVIEHFEIEPVHDRTSGHVTADVLPGVDVNSYQIGTQYYVASPSIHFRPTHAKLILDSLFENTVIGGASGYLRNYSLEDAPATPSSRILSMAKNTAKAGHDSTYWYAGGVVTGFTFSQELGQALKLSFRVAFCHRTAVAGHTADAEWESNHADGNQDITRLSDIIAFAFGPEGTPAALNVSSWSYGVSWEFEPSFYAAQEPDYIVRGKPSISGSFTLRDKTSEVETLDAALKAGTPSRLVIVDSGSFAITAFCALHTGAGAEDEAKRYGNYSFTGALSTTRVTPLALTITPERA